MSGDGMSNLREMGWRGPILALLSLMLIPVTPLRVITPIEQSIVLLVPAIAACAIAAWWQGGRGALALLWIALAAWTLSRPVTGGTAGFDALARGWSLVVAAAFGAVACFGRTRTFLGRAGIAVTAALVVGLTVIVATGRGGLGDTVYAELAQRSDRTVDALETTMAASPRWAELVARDTTPAAFRNRVEESLESMARGAVVVFPALLALETLLVLALAWTLFHRLSRVRVGAPLAPLREFRFNDQLVWGVLLGVTALVLPTLAGFRAVGWNLLVFFGALYAARGLGVMAWFLTPGRLALAVVVLLLLMFPLLGVLTFGIGIGDTWIDWRNRTRAST